ncbi:hypothetical protein MOQ_001122 [Trypanosoma cruzi marinkellei]|uniref:Kinectin n=1 Tax=Trypanosoma cruzi marinkellei TaxID=85056 RepID=K2NH37_TRYCR|nr:hypothetical protein MOQ_001122 [Trypanosoma cruzi marinkellei]
MQPRYHTPSSSSSRISGEKSDGSASEPRDAADSHLSSFASRMLLHVLSGRAMEAELDEGLAEWMEGDNSVEFGSCDDDDDKYDFGDNSNVVSSTAVSLTPSMSVSSIARAEQILQKSVPLVNGGRHIALTTEDVRRIRDKELLRFLQANSSMFVKYLQHQREDAPTATAAAAPPSTDDAKKESTEIERELNTLANRIETFITAFDSDGEEYHICVDSEGNVLVPVAAEEEEDRLSTAAATDAEDGEDEADVVDDARDGEERERDETAEVDEAFVHHTEISESELEGGEGEGKRAAPTASAEQTESRVEKGETSGAAPRRGRFGRIVRVRSPSPVAAKKFLSLPSSSLQKQPEHPSKKKKGLAGAKKRPLLTGKQPSLPVRGIGLSGEQNQRIKEIMRTDFTAEPSPYRAVPTERLAALEERLRWFQEVRGPIGAESNNAHSSDNDDEYEDERLAAMAAEEASFSPPLPLPLPTPQEQRQRTAREIGNAYMREAREQRIFESRMRSINARLSKLHDSLRMEALLPTAGVERFAGVPPPVWSRDVPPPLSEDEIASMLEVARRENAVAVEKGEAAASHGGDRDVAYLQEKLQNALRRAESIVTSFPSLPSSPDVP